LPAAPATLSWFCCGCAAGIVGWVPATLWDWVGGVVARFVAVDPIIFCNFVFAVFLRDVVLAASIWKNRNWGCLVLTA